MKFVFEKASYFLTEGGEGPRGDMMGGIPHHIEVSTLFARGAIREIPQAMHMRHFSIYQQNVTKALRGGLTPLVVVVIIIIVVFFLHF
jgi:hypothetical protein